MSEQVTTLGLSGPRFGPFFEFFESEFLARPDDGQFTELGLSGLRPPQTFLPKDVGGTEVRPDDGLFTELGLSGPRPEQVFEPKFAGQGIGGRVTLSLSPAAVLAYGRRSTIIPMVSMSIRPQGVMTFAHKSGLVGSNRIGITVSATMRYNRSGKNNLFNGSNQVSITPFGFVRVRRRKSLAGSVTTSITPRATLTRTPAPLRNHAFSGSVRMSLTPSSQTAYQAGGVDYAFSGSNAVAITPNGRISVVRETTYAIHGSVQLKLTPAATLTKTLGEPQHFAIQGSITLALIPNGSMGVQSGIINQYFFSGSNRIALTPAGSVTPKAAVPLDPDAAVLEPLQSRRRRLQRVFR